MPTASHLLGAASRGADRRRHAGQGAALACSCPRHGARLMPASALRKASVEQVVEIVRPYRAPPAGEPLEAPSEPAQSRAPRCGRLPLHPVRQDDRLYPDGSWDRSSAAAFPTRCVSTCTPQSRDRLRSARFPLERRSRGGRILLLITGRPPERTRRPDGAYPRRGRRLLAASATPPTSRWCGRASRAMAAPALSTRASPPALNRASMHTNS